jgi:hypothetical protein
VNAHQVESPQARDSVEISIYIVVLLLFKATFSTSSLNFHRFYHFYYFYQIYHQHYIYTSLLHFATPAISFHYYNYYTPCSFPPTSATMRVQWLFALGCVFQARSALAEVVYESTDGNGYTYAVVYYRESEIPWHTAHLYWHFEAFPQHNTYYSTNTGSRTDTSSLHYQQGQAATGDVIAQGQMGYE